MTWIDESLRFCNGQAITGNANSTHTVDLKRIGDQARGERPLYLQVNITEAFTDSGNNTTVDIKLGTDDSDALSSVTQRLTLPQIGVNAAVGVHCQVPIPPGMLVERYAVLQFEVTNGNASTGKVTAFLTHDIDSWAAGPTGSQTITA